MTYGAPAICPTCRADDVPAVGFEEEVLTTPSRVKSGRFEPEIREDVVNVYRRCSCGCEFCDIYVSRRDLQTVQAQGYSDDIGPGEDEAIDRQQRARDAIEVGR